MRRRRGDAWVSISADADALVRYERWRRFDSAMSSAAYTGLNRLFSADNALVRSVREVGLGVLDRLPIAKQMLVDEAAGVRGDVPRLMRKLAFRVIVTCVSDRALEAPVEGREHRAMEKRSIFGGWALPFALLAPQLLVTFLFFYWPASQAVWQSFLLQDAFGLQTDFVWFENYRDLLKQPEYYHAMATTALFCGGGDGTVAVDRAGTGGAGRQGDQGGAASTRRC